MRVMYFDDDGECVEGEATLEINGVPVDENVLRQSPFFRAVAAAEWDLIARYDRGELTESAESGKLKP